MNLYALLLRPDRYFHDHKNDLHISYRNRYPFLKFVFVTFKTENEFFDEVLGMLPITSTSFK